MPEQPEIKTRIRNFLHQRLVLQEAVDWINVDELAENLMTETGLDDLAVDAVMWDATTSLFRKMRS